MCMCLYMCVCVLPTFHGHHVGVYDLALGVVGSALVLPRVDLRDVA